MARDIPFIDESPFAADVLARAEILYSDLDGTLLGLGGALLADADGRPSTVAAEAIADVNRAGLPVVICSGRNRIQSAEIARLCGWRSFIAELGGVAVHDRGGEPVYWTGDWPSALLDGSTTPFEVIEKAGALDALRAAFPGAIEEHAPYHLNREATHVLRGHLDVDAAQAVLDRLDVPIRIVDNGIIRPPATTLVGVEEIHAYHLIPAGITKVGAVTRDLEHRDLPGDLAIAIGDSPADVEIAGTVALMVVVANALDDSRVRAAATRHGNVIATRARRGEGWAELVTAWLRTRNAQ